MIDFHVPWPCIHSGCRDLAVVGLMCRDHFRETVLGPMRHVMRDQFSLTDAEVDGHKDAFVAVAEAACHRSTRDLSEVLASYPEFADLLRNRVGRQEVYFALNGVQRPDGTVKVDSFDIVSQPPVPGTPPAVIGVDYGIGKDHTAVTRVARRHEWLSEVLMFQPMALPERPIFDVHVMTPEEAEARRAQEFECEAYNVGTNEEPWRKGKLRMTRRDDGAWAIAFWNDAPPLTECTPALVAVTNTWTAPRPGLYPNLPEGTTYVAFGWASGGVTIAHPFAIPIDQALELRDKVRFPPLLAAGPEYGG